MANSPSPHHRAVHGDWDPKLMTRSGDFDFVASSTCTLLENVNAPVVAGIARVLFQQNTYSELRKLKIHWVINLKNNKLNYVY